jgi:aminoglycoside 6'-N-acetyltransferase I
VAQADSSLTVRRLQAADRAGWARLRAALWPEASPEEHAREMDAMLEHPDRDAVFLCVGPQGRLLGFAEASLRRYAEGCDTSPVGYLEGWYVTPAARRQGIGAALVAAAEAWARAQGCTEMASDTQLGNHVSQAAHARLGYQEVERLVCFRKELEP